MGLGCVARLCGSPQGAERDALWEELKKFTPVGAPAEGAEEGEAEAPSASAPAAAAHGAAPSAEPEAAPPE